MSDLTPLQEAGDRWASALSPFLADTLGGDAIKTLREQAYSRFTSLGLPHSKAEQWRYTPMKGLWEKPWHPVKRRTNENGKVPDLLASLPQPLQGFPTIILSEGKAYLMPEQVESNASIQTLADALLTENPPVLGTHLPTNSLSATATLNCAAFTDGAWIKVPKGVKVEQPIVVAVSQGTGGEFGAYHYRSLIEVEEGGEATVILYRTGQGEAEVMGNGLNEVRVANGGKLKLYSIVLQAGLGPRFGSTYIHQERDSHVTHCLITMGGQLVRNELTFSLAGPGSTAEMYGLYMGRGEQHVENLTFVDHKMPNCYSNQLYKGILLDSSTAAFSGRIRVEKDAQKTNAYQSNKNLLLSDKARVTTKPQLEILADDVKCSHGATTGQLDEAALFYLRTRGIGLREARLLLTYAFADDILARIELEGLREWLHGELRPYFE